MATHRLRILVFLQSLSKMTLDEFRESLTTAEPPAGLTHALAGLWWDARGDWTRAHEAAQQDEGMEGSWIHAYRSRDNKACTYRGSVLRITQIGLFLGRAWSYL